MNTERYLQAWGLISPIMLARLVLVGQLLEASGFSALEPAPTQAGDEEFRLDWTFKLADKIVGGLEFTLHDADVQGGPEEAFGISLQATGPEAEVMGGWFPGRYTEDAYTIDHNEIIERLVQFPVDEAAASFIDSFTRMAHKHKLEPA